MPAELANGLKVKTARNQYGQQIYIFFFYDDGRTYVEELT